MLTNKERLERKLKKLEIQKKAVKEVVDLQKKIEAEKKAIAKLKGDVSKERLNKLASLLKKMEKVSSEVGKRAYMVNRNVEEMMVPKVKRRKRRY